MNGSSHTEAKELDPSTLFLYFKLEYCYYRAGDKINGEVLLNIPKELPPSKLRFESTGYEYAAVTTLDNLLFNYKNEIFHMDSIINTWEEKTLSGQFNFPFSFNLPYFAPATFDFSSKNKDSCLLEGKIWYEVIVTLESENETILTDKLPIVILNNKDRCEIHAGLTTDSLTTCCCIKKGKTELSLQQSIERHPSYGDNVQFRLEVDWKNSNGKIVEIKGAVVYHLQLQIPGDKTYEFSCKLCNFSPSSSFISQFDKIHTTSEFEVDIKGNFGNNVTTNATGMIDSRFVAEASVFYNLGFTRHVSTVFVPLHVNPKPGELREFLNSCEWKFLEKLSNNALLRERSGSPIFSTSRSSLDISNNKVV